MLILVSMFSFNTCKNTEMFLKKVQKNAVASDQSYQALEYLSKQAPGRLPGTPQSEKAIKFIEQKLKDYGADSVWLFPVKAPGWSELKKPVVEVLFNNNKVNLNSVSLGECVSTTDDGVDAPVVVINSRDQIDSLGENGLKGKIVFFNLKMQTRGDYGKMVWQRVQGASLVSKYGAIGVLERSLTTKYDDNPHTGVVRYDDNYPKIPAVGISWKAADSLEILLAQEPQLKVHIETFCNNPGLVPSYNVIGEIKGSKYPDQILFLTGHLDAWHNAEGTQDDGGGVVQIIDVIRIFKTLGIRPLHTIRVMPYMDEEQYMNGMKQYEDYIAKTNQRHIFETEVDGGIGIPVGFSIQADSIVFTKQDQWRKYLAKLNANDIRFSGTYAKDWPLYPSEKIIMSRLSCNDEHYFDYHHSANDIFATADKHNLQMGSAVLATFIYILDKMDVIDNSKRSTGEFNLPTH